MEGIEERQSPHGLKGRGVTAVGEERERERKRRGKRASKPTLYGWGVDGVTGRFHRFL